MSNQSENERRSSDDGKSEGCIVPLKPGSSGGGGNAQSTKLKLYATLGRKSLLYSPEVRDCPLSSNWVTWRELGDLVIKPFKLLNDAFTYSIF
jgi:hypothetical protein